MKTIIKPQIPLFLLILLFSLVGNVSAYYVYIDAPSEVQVGDVINITGTSNLPPPDTLNLVFSHSVNIPIEKDRKTILIEETGDKEFNATFDTAGLDKGQYKVEILSDAQRDFSAGSRSIRIIKLIDRSDEITIHSSTNQDFDGTLNIEGYIQDFNDDAVCIELIKDGTVIYGPEFIPVNRQGDFEFEIPILEAGDYDISFSDYKSAIGTYEISVKEEKILPSKTPVAVETPLIPEKDTASETPEPEPENVETVSATVSHEKPGYFLIKVSESPVTITTSTGVDWVVEYSSQSNTEIVKVNKEGKLSSEKLKIDEAGGNEIYLKVYPYSFKSEDEITLSVTNSDSIDKSSAKSMEIFGDLKEEPAESPLSVYTGIFGIIGALFLVRRFT